MKKILERILEIGNESRKYLGFIEALLWIGSLVGGGLFLAGGIVCQCLK